jgi:hypothetical protein
VAVLEGVINDETTAVTTVEGSQSKEFSTSTSHTLKIPSSHHFASIGRDFIRSIIFHTFLLWT